MTVRFLVDENFNRAILVGVQRRAEHIDVARVQNVGPRTADDPLVLQWAADQGRVLVTHDIKTIPDFAHQRVSNRPASGSLPGCFRAECGYFARSASSVVVRT